jgi:hypothetical protein
MLVSTRRSIVLSHPLQKDFLATTLMEKSEGSHFFFIDQFLRQILTNDWKQAFSVTSRNGELPNFLRIS